MKYVGSRYVPKFMGTYDATQIYEALCVVDNGLGTSYISQKIVPAGTPLTNTSYWAVYGASSGAIINLQDQIDQIHETFVTPEMFGAVGDGITDDTKAIQDALDAAPYVIFDNKTYMVDAEVHIIPNSGNVLMMSPGTILKAISNSADYYGVIYLNNVSYVVITGGNIQGDRNTHLTLTGESGHCINCRDCTDILIENVHCYDAWGDGIFIGGDNVLPQNIIIRNCESDHNRRQGISVIRGTDILIDGCNIHDISGTAPENNIDLEPNYDYEYLRNILIKNCKLDGRLEVHLQNSHVANDIAVIDCIGGGYVAATSSDTINSIIKFINCNANFKQGSFNMQNASASSSVYVLNCTCEADSTQSDITHSGLYFAGANNNIYVDDLKLIGSTFNRFVADSTLTPVTCNNVNVSIILDNAVASYAMPSLTTGREMSLIDKTPQRATVALDVYLQGSKKYILSGGSTFKFDTVKVDSDIIVCNVSSSNITVTKSSSFTGSFIDSTGTDLTSITLAPGKFIELLGIAETNCVMLV